MKFIRYSVLSVLILSTISPQMAFSECIQGKIKHTYKSKEVISNENYCYELDSLILLSSNPCAGDKVCRNKDLEPIELKKSEMSPETGSLGFKICEKYQGTPQIIEFWANNEWHSTSRCVFSDGSFIDNSTLALKVKYLD